MTTAQLDSALWYLGRGAGVVTLLAFTLTLVLGIITRSGRPLPGLPRFAVAEVHRTTSLLATSLLAVHIVTLTLDTKAQLGWIDAVLPFTGQWRPFYVGLGALAVDLTLALVVTSLLRDRIHPRAWRAVHWSAYAMWPLALVHGLGTGTDAGSGWFTDLVVTLACRGRGNVARGVLCAPQPPRAPHLQRRPAAATPRSRPAPPVRPTRPPDSRQPYAGATAAGGRTSGAGRPRRPWRRRRGR